MTSLSRRENLTQWRIKVALQYVERIRTKSQFGEDSYRNDIDIQESIDFNLEHLAEEITKLPQWLRNSERQLPWNEISEMRNVLAHEYTYGDRALIWKFIQGRLTSLEHALHRMAAEHKQRFPEADPDQPPRIGRGDASRYVRKPKDTP